MGSITSGEYEMELAKLVEQARRLGVQADMLAAKAGGDLSGDVADMLGAALGDGMQAGRKAEPGAGAREVFHDARSGRLEPRRF